MPPHVTLLPPTQVAAARLEDDRRAPRRHRGRVRAVRDAPVRDRHLPAGVRRRLRRRGQRDRALRAAGAAGPVRAAGPGDEVSLPPARDGGARHPGGRPGRGVRGAGGLRRTLPGHRVHRVRAGGRRGMGRRGGTSRCGGGDAWPAPAGSRTASPALCAGSGSACPWLDHLVRAYQRYKSTNGDHLAAAITYFSFLALFPLILLGISVAGFVLANNDALQQDLQELIRDNVPGDLGTQLSDSVHLDHRQPGGHRPDRSRRCRLRRARLDRQPAHRAAGGVELRADRGEVPQGQAGRPAGAGRARARHPAVDRPHRGRHRGGRPAGRRRPGWTASAGWAR